MQFWKLWPTCFLPPSLGVVRIFYLNVEVFPTTGTTLVVTGWTLSSHHVWENCIFSQISKIIFLTNLNYNFLFNPSPYSTLTEAKTVLLRNDLFYVVHFNRHLTNTFFTGLKFKLIRNKANSRKLQGCNEDLWLTGNIDSIGKDVK